MATSATGSAVHPNSTSTASPTLRPSSDEDHVNPLTHHARGHGSFSAQGYQRPQILASRPAEPPQAVSNAVLNPLTSVEKPVVHRLNASGSVQALAVDDDVLFAGLHGGEIVAWSLETYEQLARVHAHQQSVLNLSLSEDRSLLFSTGVDSVVNVWSTESLRRLYSLHSPFEVGDVFCVAYSTRTKTLFWGAQNASIQWYEIDERSAQLSNPESNPSLRKHRFFDSLGPGGVPTPLPETDNLDGAFEPITGQTISVPQSNYLQYAHKSYIYSMLLAKGLVEDDPEQEILITADGAGVIKLWSINHAETRRPVLLEKFKNKAYGVHSLAYKAPFLYAGLSGGIVHVYNLASRQLVQKAQVGCGQILQIQISNGNALCGTSEGWVKRISKRFTEVDRWVANSGKILATATSVSHGRNFFMTGGSDRTIALWDVSDKAGVTTDSAALSNDEMVDALRQFVSYRSVAANPNCISDCHQAATFLRKQFSMFGANTSLFSPQEGVNPVLLAKFDASTKSESTKTVLFYGHYDVVDAEWNAHQSSQKWHADPFTLYPLNGYLYGRGVTDNKGPILAALYGVADLVQHDALSCNVIFLLEGDEEAGSRGFRSAVQRHKQEIGEIDFVMLSNSYWLDDHIPCLTFGMRGVVHATITITSNRPDLHSGMDGKSLQHEPLKDLTVLLSSLIGETGTKIQVPRFYDSVDALQPTELRAYSKITSSLLAGHPEIKNDQAFTQSLVQKWREPSLTIHQISVPESKTAVTISRAAKATLSVRIVPSQSSDDVATQLETFLQDQFARLQSTNTIGVVITSKADPWLGQIQSDLYSELQEAVTEVWNSDDSTAHRSFPQQADHTSKSRPPHRRGSNLITTGTFTSLNTPREPLFIREGGSIPAISFLEKEFDAPAAMFPMGQASDNAHLDNERIRLENLYKGKEVLKRVFARL